QKHSKVLPGLFLTRISFFYKTQNLAHTHHLKSFWNGYHKQKSAVSSLVLPSAHFLYILSNNHAQGHRCQVYCFLSSGRKLWCWCWVAFEDRTIEWNFPWGQEKYLPATCFEQKYLLDNLKLSQKK